MAGRGSGWGQDPWWGRDSRWGRGSGRGWGSGSRASCSGKPRQCPHHSKVSVFGDIRGHPSAHGEAAYLVGLRLPCSRRRD